MWLAALLLLLLPLSRAGAPPAPWFGPTAVWTPPWFSPATPLQYLPDPASPGNPPPSLIAQGMRSAVFNRLMPEGELYPGGPAHQLSDGRIFTPKWKLAGPSPVHLRPFTTRRRQAGESFFQATNQPTTFGTADLEKCCNLCGSSCKHRL